MFDGCLEELHLIVQKPDKKIWLVYGKDTKTYYIKKIIYKFGKVEVYRNLMNHPCIGIPNIYDIQEQEDCLVIVEEFINGKSLDILMSEKKLDEVVVHKIFLQLCDIVHHLDFFDPPIIHRDIKPANIIFTPEQIYLIDYDIARTFEQKLDKDTTIIGSVGYAAPEQYGFTQSDRRSDIYAMGILLNELITTHAPNISMPSDDRKKIIAKCISMDPNNRYQNVMDMKADYEQFIQGIKPETINGQNKQGYAFPGFRNKKKSHMVIASLGYLCWLYLASTATFSRPATSIYEEIFYRLSIAIMVLLMIFVPCNYRDIQNITILSKSKYMIIRIFNMFMIWLCLSVSIMMIGVILTKICESLL